MGWLWLGLLACSGSKDDDGGATDASEVLDTVDTAELTTSGTTSTADSSTTSTFAADLPLGGCGLAPYELVGPDALGTIVEVEEAPDLSLSASTIELTLSLADLPGERFGITYDVETWRVRYTTQDRGELVEATMLLSFPVGAGAVPTLAWLHGTTGFTDACAPSALGIEGGAFNLLFASMGYVVVAPDYLGMNGIGDPSWQVHPYVVAEPTALASLDAVRAAWGFDGADATGSEATLQTVWLGASEGGFAALWADRYQPHYLPEAEPVAVVASVPPADMVGLAQFGASQFSDASGGLVAAFTTWHDWFRLDGLDEVLADPLADIVPDLLLADCSVDLDPEPTSLDKLFTAGFMDAMATGDLDAYPVGCVMEQGRLATSAVPRRSEAPVLYVVAELDELVAAEPTRAAFEPLCDAGYQMNYIECADADHVDGAVWSLGQQLDWVRDRVAGVAMDEVCVQTAPQRCDLQPKKP